jgi:hypothetical protein
MELPQTIRCFVMYSTYSNRNTNWKKVVNRQEIRSNGCAWEAVDD